MEEIIKNLGYKICHQYEEDGKNQIIVSYEDLNLSESSIKYLKESDINLWKHQHESIRLIKEGKNVCVTTSTSSGKTQIFHLAAMETLARNPHAKVIAVYPMKALGSQQVQRWSRRTGLTVGKIDGDTPFDQRAQQLRCDILVITPDTLHTYLLGKLNDRTYGNSIKDFITNVSMIIIDELHLYKGYFGTNAAYMFRRLNNVRRLLRKDTRLSTEFPIYLTASATLPNAPHHSSQITGVDNFVEVGMDMDGSPSRPKKFFFIESQEKETDRDSQIKNLVFAIAKHPEMKSITFVGSRQKTGNVAYDYKDAEDRGIFPYRSGYEERARENIQSKLEEGVFKGVISTSALEIGIDIDGLNVVIIADMPFDKNSYQQRIGRCGRYGCNGDSYVIVVRDPQSFASNLLFGEYEYDMDKALPNYEPSLYLEDREIQMIHALCHVGNTSECEYETWKGNIPQGRMSFSDGGCFPSSFVELCNEVLSANASAEYDRLEQASDNPHYTHSLRYFGHQYQIYDLDNDKQIDKPISRNQIATEAYPGAVRYTLNSDGRNIRHRVRFLDLNADDQTAINVKRENDPYVKTQSVHRTFLIPNFQNGVNLSFSCGDTRILNQRVYEYVNIYGYYEIKGHNREYKKYKRCERIPRFPTTGTTFFHSSFKEQGVNVNQIAQIVYEALLRRNAFDRSDLNYYGGRLFTANTEFNEYDKFIALYDTSSLNLSKSITDNGILDDLFQFLSENRIDMIADAVCGEDLRDATRRALHEFCECMRNNTPTVKQGTIVEKKFRQYTLVAYRQYEDENDKDNSQYTELEVTYVGVGSLENTVALFSADKGLLRDIDIDDVYPIDGKTQYE